MINKSAPSFGSFAFDVPEPDRIEADFIYSYYLKDERVSDNPLSNTEAADRHGGESARRVKISFTPFNQITALPMRYYTSNLAARTFLQQKATNAISEIQVQCQNTAFVATQDDELAGELQSIIDAEIQKENAEERGLSPLEAVLKYNSITSDKISAEDILNTTDIESNLNLTYYDPATGEDLTYQKQGGTSKFSIGAFYNKKFIYDILQSSENTPFSPLWGTVDSILSSAEAIQEEATSTIDSNIGNMAEYEFSARQVDAIDVPSGTFPNRVEGAGYVIFKYLVNADGTTILKKRHFIVASSINEWNDNSVKYGETYRYQIQSLFFLSTIGQGTQSGNIWNTFLIGSRGSPYIDVTCVETVPPPPPSNIEFFLSQEQDMLIIWDMPFNTQEDIKRFQIFRRDSLEEPYTIIAELDFDDSVVQTERTEYIPQYSKIVKEAQTTAYSDSDFEFDKEYYYAICSVDAHDLSSPYSTQFKVFYDRIDGKMKVVTVAFSGAPKAYPNFTLKETLIVDCMKDSGHSKMKVYFDPECLILKGAEQEISEGSPADGVYSPQEDYIETSDYYPMYKLQILNLDRQQDKTVGINIKRTSEFTDSEVSREIAEALPDVSS